MTTEPELDAYALLSRPTLDFTDAEVKRVIADLRRRREAYLRTGKPDRPKKVKEQIEKAKASPEDKARNTAALLAQLDLKV